jgi:8-oxo-dGTP pyrophosphatase MutT (NUDIX family)
MSDAFVVPVGRVEPSDHAGDGDEAAFRRAAARELKEEAGVEVDAAELRLFARWITPSAEPKRFDAWFFMVRVPAGQEARHDAVEAVEHLWATPSELLARHDAGGLKLPPPTLRNLQDLATPPTAEACLAWAAAQPVVAIQPKLVPLGDALAIILPWDPEYASLPGEGAPIAADHALARPPTRLILREGRWWAAPNAPI